jgi:hypothetical protein
VPRRDPDRIAESDLVLPTLRLAASCSRGFISTSDLICELEELFEPAGDDAEILGSRTDSRFSQKVRNLVSHRESENSFIRNGYAQYDAVRRGIQITEQGRDLLKKLNG